MRRLPADALPAAVTEDAWLQAQRKAVLKLHGQRYAPPTRRNATAFEAWADEVFAPWLEAHGQATVLLAESLSGAQRVEAHVLTGYVYEDFVAQVIAAPHPMELDGDETAVASYRAELFKVAAPWLELGLASYDRSLELAAGESAPWTRFASARLALWAPLRAPATADSRPRGSTENEAISWPEVCAPGGAAASSSSLPPSSEPLYIAVRGGDPGTLPTQEIEHLLDRAGAWVAEHANVQVVPRTEVARAEAAAQRGKLPGRDRACAAPVAPERVLAARYPNLAVAQLDAHCTEAKRPSCSLSLRFRRPGGQGAETSPSDLPRDTEPVRWQGSGLGLDEWLRALAKLRLSRPKGTEKPSYGVIGVGNERWSPPPFSLHVTAHGAWREPTEARERVTAARDSLTRCALLPTSRLGFTLDVAPDGRASVIAGLDAELPGHACVAAAMSAVSFSQGSGTRRVEVEGRPGPLTRFRWGAYRLSSFSGRNAPPDAGRTLDDWPLAAAITACRKGPDPLSAAAWDVTLELSADGRVSNATLKGLAGPRAADEERCVREALARLAFGCPLGPDARIEARICAASGLLRPTGIVR